jgi:hypothetical protein
MVLEGNWTTSWKFVESWVSDPYRAKANAASELELEASLGSVKIKREFVKRGRQVSQWPAIEKTGQREERREGQKGKAEARKKSELFTA